MRTIKRAAVRIPRRKTGSRRRRPRCHREGNTGGTRLRHPPAVSAGSRPAPGERPDHTPYPVSVRTGERPPAHSPGARKLGILFQPFPPFPALGAGGPPHSEGMARPERPLMLRHRTPFPRRFLRSPGISATLFRFNSSSAWPGSFIRPMSEKGTKNILDNQPAWGIKGIGCCTRHHPAKWPEPILQHNGGSPGAGLTMSYTEKSKQRRKSPLY